MNYCTYIHDCKSANERLKEPQRANEHKMQHETERMTLSSEQIYEHISRGYTHAASRLVAQINSCCNDLWWG